MNNWPNDPQRNCKKIVDLKKYRKTDAFLVDDYDLIEEVEYFKGLHLDDD
jgi:hypothetical protein